MVCRWINCRGKEGQKQRRHTKAEGDNLAVQFQHTETECALTAKRMEVSLGSYTIPLLGVSIFFAVLTYIFHKMLSSYLHKWFEMKPIPGVEGTYLFIGNAMQFKNNAGGKKAGDCSDFLADC